MKVNVSGIETVIIKDPLGICDKASISPSPPTIGIPARATGQGEWRERKQEFHDAIQPTPDKFRRGLNLGIARQSLDGRHD